jgi:hypothetical protein
LLAVGGWALGCAPDGSVRGEPGIAMRSVAVQAMGERSRIGLEVVATRSDGSAIACAANEIEVEVEVSFAGGPFVPVAADAVNVRCSGDQPRDVALVLDNSGSQESVLLGTQDGARDLVDAVLRSDGRVALTRVTTWAEQLTELTDDADGLDNEIDGLFVNRGWTALYDGVRLAHEHLGVALQQFARGHNEADSSCYTVPSPAIVVFSNGADNNSANEKSELGDDGFDTVLEDLFNLRIGSVQTPVFTIGLGDYLNEEVLQTLADETGGRHLQASSAHAIAHAFDLISHYGPQSLQVCADIDELSCGPATVRIRYRYFDGDEPREEVRETQTTVKCPAEEPPRGRTVVYMLTMSNPGIPQDVAEKMVRNAVAHVQPSESPPAVLVVLDDNHHDEFAGDGAYIHELLRQQGFDADFTEESESGMSAADFADYDVVWLTNPGWPVDDESTMIALSEHLAAGGGVVLSGDDMSWSFGRGFAMSEWTHLEHGSNGTVTCEQPTDNNLGEKSVVQIGASSHPLVTGLGGVSFEYGDDIDHATVLGEGEQVHAWARLAGDPECSVVTPVIVSFDPTP